MGGDPLAFGVVGAPAPAFGDGEAPSLGVPPVRQAEASSLRDEYFGVLDRPRPGTETCDVLFDRFIRPCKTGVFGGGG